MVAAATHSTSLAASSVAGKFTLFFDQLNHLLMISSTISLTLSFTFRSRQRAQEERTGPNMNIKLKVTLEDVYAGKEMEIKYTRNTLCPHCRGTGADDPEDIKVCPKCNGQGVVMETQRLGPGFIQQFQTQCNACGGKGKTKTSTCHECQGHNTKQALDELYVFIEAGTPDGHEERFRDAADEFVNIRAGEVVFKIQVLPHKRFLRDGDNLKMTQEITLKQALLGFSITIKHLDGHEVEISKAQGEVTQPGEVMRIRDEGMPKYGMASERGDLLVTFKIRNPDTLTAEQKNKLKTFF